MKSFLYEVIVGFKGKDAVPAVDATAEQPATAEVPAVPYSERVDLKNVVATDVADAMTKVTLLEGQFFSSVTKLSEIHSM